MTILPGMVVVGSTNRDDTGACVEKSVLRGLRGILFIPVDDMAPKGASAAYNVYDAYGEMSLLPPVNDSKRMAPVVQAILHELVVLWPQTLETPD